MATPKVPLADLLTEGSIERVERDTVNGFAFLEQAERHIGTARAAVELEDYEGALSMAYSACRKCCLALLHVVGFRPTGDATHATTFIAAAAIADNFGARHLVDDAHDLRLARHNTEYRATAADPADARDAIEIALELRSSLHAQVNRIADATS